MKKYIGCKLVEAEPMTRGEYNHFRKWTIPKDENTMDEGYLVRYSDYYVSWSPKEVFDTAYLQVDENKDRPAGVRISQDMIDSFIAHIESYTISKKTTVVHCVLKNGFEIVESSSCVNPENYSEEMGRRMCMNKISDKVWELLAFLLQTARYGVR